MRRAVAVLAFAGLCAGGGIVPTAGQSPSEGGDSSVQDQIAGVIASRWGLVVPEVHVEFMDGTATDRIDSLLVRGGASDRWIVTMWSEEGVARRFVRAGVAGTVSVAARDLQRNYEMLSEDVGTEKRVVWGPPRPSAPDPVGMVTSRIIMAGEVLVAPAVRPPLLFKGGDPVEALFHQAGVSLRVRAEALASAREGDQLFVRLESGKRMAAIAIAKGVVQLIGGGDG